MICPFCRKHWHEDCQARLDLLLCDCDCIEDDELEPEQILRLIDGDVA